MVVRDYRVKHVFIDRERELTILKDLLTRMRNKKGQVIVIDGEHGIGKTRLIEEFMKFAETEKVQVRIGSCKSTESHSPYQPITEALDYNLQMSSNIETPEERSGIRELDTSSRDKNNGINNSFLLTFVTSDSHKFIIASVFVYFIYYPCFSLASWHSR